MEENKINIVEIVTISKLTPVFKNDEEANAIELANFNFSNGDECGFNIVVQKGLYKIGSKAIYIQPDYCLSDIKLFESFIAPGGDIKKSRLGKNARIRAIKFNFSLENSSDPIYSFGILLPIFEVENYLKTSVDGLNLSEVLGITKYEEPEKAGSGLIVGDFPSFMYKTDENNINNIVSKVKKVISEGQKLGITLKHDGSSHTTYFKKINGEYKCGVCSRSQEKSLEQKYISEYIDNNENVYHKYINPITKEKGWFCDKLNDFRLDADMTEMKQITVGVNDTWVNLAHSSGLLSKGLEYCKKHNLELAFRSEIYGSGLKGSGNNLNPDAKEKQTLRVFGIDDLSKGFAERINYASEHNLRDVCTILNLNYTPTIFVTVNSYEELCKICDDIFDQEAKNGRIIEGVVIRTAMTNDISCKYMNPVYDAKK